MSINDKYIKDLFFDNKKYIRASLVRKVNTKDTSISDILIYLQNRYNDSKTLKESLYRILYNIEEIPCCPVCKSKLNFVGCKGVLYRSHCSVRCSSLDKNVQTKLKESCKIKYGVENYSQTKEYQEKCKRTCLERYGTEYSFQSENNKRKSKETLLKKYGSTTYRNLEKGKETNIKKYGVPYAFQSNIVKEKIYKTNIIKYGQKNPNQFTNKKSYEKFLETCKSKYGTTHPMKNSVVCDRNIKSKIKNGTISYSKPEEELYLYIKEKFPNVIRQYKDKERYPWHCDFYIPELDYFIELNGTWTHGKHPFNMNSKEDISMLNIWKEKYNNGEHPWYKNAIEGWTINDVKKRNKAKEENLNYKEVWNLNEGKDFIDKLHKQFTEDKEFINN